ncbi:MAG: SPOR domain-containing protein, partial [Burkholderiales bacterium]
DLAAVALDLVAVAVEWRAMKAGLSPRAACTRGARLLLILLLVILAAAAHAQAQSATVPAAAKTSIDKKSEPAKNCYAVQVGAYEERSQAAAMMDSLAREFSNAIQMSQTIDGSRTRWRVRILAMSRAEARAISARLLSKRGMKVWMDPVACPNL